MSELMRVSKRFLEVQYLAAAGEVRLTNACGSFVAIAEVSDTIRPSVVAGTKGHWPCDSKEHATVTATATVDERDSDMRGGAVSGTACASTEPQIQFLSSLVRYARHILRVLRKTSAFAVGAHRDTAREPSESGIAPICVAPPR
jgi:hypothetical protein